jgi:AraC-like DNA-binding protein
MMNRVCRFASKCYFVSVTNNWQMGWRSENDAKVDPSGVKQHFSDIGIKLHCCRYWKLNEWEFNNLSFPFWRLYYNTVEGARVNFKNKVVELTANKVVLIPPYTSFSTSLKQINAESLSGNRISSVEELGTLKEMGMVDHLFIHFNLGFQYDHLFPGIFEFEVDDQTLSLLNEIRYSIIEQYSVLPFSLMVKIYSLILMHVSKIPAESWKARTTDNRVLKVIDFIDVHLKESLSNEVLAEKAAMSANSFLRLFKATTGFTLQQYLQSKRIEMAILMMHHSQDAAIEQIAEKCGFSDRHHFSKVFKRIVKVAPAQYRKTQTI